MKCESQTHKENILGSKFPVYLQTNTDRVFICCKFPFFPQTILFLTYLSTTCTPHLYPSPPFALATRARETKINEKVGKSLL